MGLNRDCIHPCPSGVGGVFPSGILPSGVPHSIPTYLYDDFDPAPSSIPLYYSTYSGQLIPETFPGYSDFQHSTSSTPISFDLNKGRLILASGDGSRYVNLSGILKQEWNTLKWGASITAKSTLFPNRGFPHDVGGVFVNKKGLIVRNSGTDFYSVGYTDTTNQGEPIGSGIFNYSGVFKNYDRLIVTLQDGKPLIGYGNGNPFFESGLYNFYHNDEDCIKCDSTPAKSVANNILGNIFMPNGFNVGVAGRGRNEWDNLCVTMSSGNQPICCPGIVSGVAENLRLELKYLILQNNSNFVTISSGNTPCVPVFSGCSSITGISYPFLIRELGPINPGGPIGPTPFLENYRVPVNQTFPLIYSSNQDEWFGSGIINNTSLNGKFTVRCGGLDSFLWLQSELVTSGGYSTKMEVGFPSVLNQNVTDSNIVVDCFRYQCGNIQQNLFTFPSGTICNNHVVGGRGFIYRASKGLPQLVGDLLVSEPIFSSNGRFYYPTDTVESIRNDLLNSIPSPPIGTSIRSASRFAYLYAGKSPYGRTMTCNVSSASYLPIPAKFWLQNNFFDVFRFGISRLPLSCGGGDNTRYFNSCLITHNADPVNESDVIARQVGCELFQLWTNVSGHIPVSGFLSGGGISFPYISVAYMPVYGITIIANYFRGNTPINPPDILTLVNFGCLQMQSGPTSALVPITTISNSPWVGQTSSLSYSMSGILSDTFVWTNGSFTTVPQVYDASISVGYTVRELS